jgi:tellurite resistance protein
MIKYSDLRTRKIDLIIWCDAELKKFGFATKGLKPSQLIFDSKEKAEKAARKMIKAAFDSAIADGSLIVDSRLQRETAMIKYSYLRTRKIDLIIWCDAELKKFGFATKGLKPSQLIFDSKEKAEKAARKMIKAAFDSAIADGSLIVDSRLFFS